MLNTVVTDFDLDLLSTEAGTLSTILHQPQEIASFGYVNLIMLNTVLTDSNVDLLSTEAGTLSTILHTDIPQEIASSGYPLSYQANMEYLWKVESSPKNYARITFVDIALRRPPSVL